ncbi:MULTISPECIES: hypothetical protein [Streptomycetaceae]|uniref:Uncharacterized protein n=1 Tax=Streptantibioticus cattleyicolor (strain ATCC 35852 / DSM 46488 / JCM 4925 / NBRC 14057 / NRRL 8057) TaxID=1003195 RepID=F8JRN2_STREN|nr:MULTISPECIES: hypothetical protein [Streptomycetaceae]AEW97919.1 hypothetical protein SCATT_55480 [Streptantibioticus cattleyicolor NRRL 8057 = DSM 46488]MYS62324.1 hypothetical protein [Streptomyces sp. SID5468]CCB78234.1 conserved protein of unknown function [Streptantibioticus cattleyicolor NRRL 8057 = DSM 46488]
MHTHTDQRSPHPVTVDVHTMGRTFEESAVDRWELEAARRALKNLKAVAGGQVMMDLLADQIEAGDRFHAGLVEASGGTYRESRTEFTVRGLSGTDLARWFRSQAATGRFQDKTALLNAHPEHYVEPPEYTGGMVETIGNHLTRFKVSVARELPPPVSAHLDASYPISLMNALLSLDDGTPFAYCLHQARDTATGADVVVRVVYPSAAPDSMIEGHCEHLAIEFRSWIRNAAAATR